MIINHNMNAMNAQRNMGINNTSLGKSMEKLSSGLRINRAGDDAAGLAISEKMRGQIRGLDQASRNSEDGISLIQTAEGALNETHSILQRMRELAVQAGNDTNTSDDRTQIQEELNQLTSEINRIGNTTEFNTQKLLDGNKSGNAIKVGDTLPSIKGVYTVDIKAGATDGFTIGGQAVTVAAGDAGKASAVADKLNGVAAFTAKYNVEALDDNTLKITEKTATGTAITVAGAGIDGAVTTVKASSTNQVATDADVKEGKVKLQIGANQGQSLSIEIADMRAEALGISKTTATTGFTATQTVSDGTKDTNEEYALDVSTHDNAANAITAYDNALNTVSTQRSKLGALQNRLEHTIANLGTSAENLTSAESRVRDVDMAKEMMTFSKNNILQQAAQSMLSQANQQPQQVLQLLR